MSSLRWHAAPTGASLQRAASKLAAQTTAGEARPVVDRLRHASTTSIPSGDLVREAHRPPLPSNDPRVRRQAEKIAAGRPLRPLVVLWLPDGHLEVLDGWHRASAAYRRNPAARVEVLWVDGPTQTRSDMSSKKEIKKAERRAERLQKFTDAFADALTGATPPCARWTAAIPSPARGLRPAAQGAGGLSAGGRSAQQRDRRGAPPLGGGAACRQLWWPCRVERQ